MKRIRGKGKGQEPVKVELEGENTNACFKAAVPSGALQRI